MGRKIFVSYKYHDYNVRNFPGKYDCTPRDYVDVIENKINREENHIYKGEQDGEDLSSLTEDKIWEKLKKRIFDSSVTIVLISPNMKEAYKRDRDQWIPWEISYSLKEVSRNDQYGNPRTSKTNAMLAVVLPSINGSYDYFINNNSCCKTTCTTFKTENLFYILEKNMFNKKNCPSCTCQKNSNTIWIGEPSYISLIKWDDFINNMDKYINQAIQRQDNLDKYDIYKEVEETVNQ